MKNFLQKKNIMAFSACTLIAAAACVIGINSANNKVKLVMNKIASDEVIKVEFEKNKPVWIDNTILVPLRTVCDSAGFSLKWDDETKSACVTLNANPDSTPAEKFCNEFLTSEKSAEAMVHNKSISVVIPVNSCDVKIYYNYTDQENEDLSFEYSHQWNAGARIIQDGTMMVPLRNIIESFGLNIDWNAKNKTATVSIPSIEELSFDAPAVQTTAVEATPDATSQIRTETPFLVSEKTTDIPQSPPAAYSSVENYTVGSYIGRFKITHYCVCSICNGSYGNSTAYGGAIRPGITIAVDPRVIKKLSWVYIEGYGARLAEDVGGAIKGNRIDMAVADHKTAMAMGVKYCDVWYADVPDGSEEINASPIAESIGQNTPVPSAEPSVKPSPAADIIVSPTASEEPAEASPSQTQEAEASEPTTAATPDNTQQETLNQQNTLN